MAALDTLAGSLLKIATDLRLLAGGPRAGLGEIRLPSLQPGSSIMPGKVNPVIPEMVAQAAVYVKGQALAVSLAASAGAPGAEHHDAPHRLRDPGRPGPADRHLPGVPGALRGGPGGGRASGAPTGSSGAWPW